MHDTRDAHLVKVPAVTLGFWVIKILATTLGETGGDALSMSMGLGYLTSSAIFFVVFAFAVALEIRAPRFNAWLYWFAILASTTVGTTLADFATRSLGIGYSGGSAILIGLLLVSLLAWQRATGRLDVQSIHTPRAEAHYWVTIMFSQTLGTALGDWSADTLGLGYLGAAALFGAALGVLALLYATTHISRTALFWFAFVLTRPLGAVVGDFLDKPLAQGGLALSRYTATFALLVAIITLIALVPQRPARHAH